MDRDSLPLHVCHVMKSRLVINRMHTFLHGIALMALIYYRVSSLLHLTKTSNGMKLILPYVLVFISELMLSFMWFVSQGYRWMPVRRTVFPERLPGDDKLPSIDVFICTADPNKEPSEGVMNTIISAMALDYPPDKVHVYLSDDGGSSVTLFAMKEAWKFARLWLPFCRKYGIKTRCPDAYFSRDQGGPDSRPNSTEFMAEKEKIQNLYDTFKNRVQKFRENTITRASKDHPAKIEVIKGEAADDQTGMPLLVYVSREKRPSHPHNFKAGALNVLLRVSSMISNSPYVLVLDCDMYCNDPSSARQAMCFHLDNKISPKLAYVQFPQKFHNASKKDIYDSRLNPLFECFWYGFDGINGPIISGCNCYIKRDALYGTSNIADVELIQLQNCFGSSNEFIKSIYQKYKPDVLATAEEIQLIASCAYEKHTQWGKEVGFRYFAVVEDYFTGLSLLSNGWKSVYLNPPRPAFLGTTTTNLSDFLVQNMRWGTGLAEVAISKYSPLLYGPSRMPILECMCLAELAFSALYSLPLWGLAVIPQLYLLLGIPMYPAVSNSFFVVFVFLFLSSNLKHIHEVLAAGDPIRTYADEQRIWMIKSITCYLYATLNAILEKFGAREASFSPTNKVDDEEQLKLYQMGVFDFQASPMFIVPMCTLVIFNLASLLIGGARMIHNRNYEEMFLQASLTLFILIIQYPVIEGMFFRKDKGRVPQSATFLSTGLVTVVLSLGYLILKF